MLLRANFNVILVILFGLAKGAYLIDFSHFYRTNTIGNVKREGKLMILEIFFIPEIPLQIAKSSFNV